MERVLVSVTSSRQSPATFKTALEEARKARGSLIAAFILETDVLDQAFEKLGDAGIVGEKPGRQLEAALLKEYRQKGYQLLDAFEKEARDAGIACKVLVEPGDFVGTTLRLARTERADLLVFKGIRRGWIGRLLFGSPEADLQEKASCSIKAVYD